jgi:hypothetical protein
MCNILGACLCLPKEGSTPGVWAALLLVLKRELVDLISPNAMTCALESKQSIWVTRHAKIMFSISGFKTIGKMK